MHCFSGSFTFASLSYMDYPVFPACVSYFVCKHRNEKGSTLTEQGPRLRVGLNFVTPFQDCFWRHQRQMLLRVRVASPMLQLYIEQASVHTDCSVSGSSRVLGTSSSSQTKGLATCSTVPAPHPACLHTSTTL